MKLFRGEDEAITEVGIVQIITKNFILHIFHTVSSTECVTDLD